LSGKEKIITCAGGAAGRSLPSFPVCPSWCLFPVSASRFLGRLLEQLRRERHVATLDDGHDHRVEPL
jgi:hypothetical protein